MVRKGHDTMNGTVLKTRGLQARLWMAQHGAIACCAVFLCLAGSLAWCWAILFEKNLLQQAPSAPITATPVSQAVVTVSAADQHLASFYDALGERRYTEQQLKTLFGLAEKNALTLSKGQYKFAYEQNARVHTYQISLPVKGSYQSIWQFATQALDAIPFASLDEIGFKRDLIADNMPEARVHLTLYLNNKDKQQVQP
jgi:hypothetical protein